MFIPNGYSPNGFSGGFWTSDGTPEGTTLLHAGYGEDSLPSVGSFTPVGDLLAFVATDAGYRQGLWTSDGTAEGTRMIAELPWDGPPPALVTLGDTLLFSAGHTLYRSNGTPEGTVRLEQPQPEPRRAGKSGPPARRPVARPRLA